MARMAVDDRDIERTPVDVRADQADEAGLALPIGGGFRPLDDSGSVDATGAESWQDTDAPAGYVPA
jgi:hypothetical protein